MKNYRQLDEALILATLLRLRDRIAERFPDSGLSRVANELLALGRETAGLNWEFVARIPNSEF